MCNAKNTVMGEDLAPEWGGVRLKSGTGLDGRDRK